MGAARESLHSATAKFILVKVTAYKKFHFSKSLLSLKALGLTNSWTAGHPLSLPSFELLLAVAARQAASWRAFFS